MNNEHIVGLLDSSSFAHLSEEDRATIEVHTRSCSECLQAFEAARVSAALMAARMDETIQPSPFFHTRVLVAWRERQEAAETWAFKRMWQAAGALVSTMTATVALLAVLTFMLPAMPATESQASLLNGYSAEEVILNQNDVPDDQASDAQVLTSLDDFGDNATR